MWSSEVYNYTHALNIFIQKGLTEGWDNAGDEPVEPLFTDMIPEFMNALRTANQMRPRQDIKAIWPPTYATLLPVVKENGQPIPQLSLLPDGAILAQIGSPFTGCTTVKIDGDEVIQLPDISFFGHCPNHRFYAIATTTGIKITDGWQGEIITHCPWPTGKENCIESLPIAAFTTDIIPTQLIPFPDGKKVLLVSSNGIFVLEENTAHRLLPTDSQLTEQYEYLLENNDGGDVELTFGLSMEHGAISTDGNFIAVGSQCSSHLIFNANLELIATVGPHSEYPHYSLFNTQNQVVALNACHFYHGATIAIPLDKLSGWQSDYYEEMDDLTVIDHQARIYAGVARNDEFIYGDAHGYIRAVSISGEPRWQHFLGSTILAMDISSDGNTLVVSSYAGFISIIRLAAGKQQPYQIGNGQNFEEKRWVFWKNESEPLAW